MRQAYARRGFETWAERNKNRRKTTLEDLTVADANQPQAFGPRERMIEARARRRCEERSDEAIHSFFARQDGLLRCARNDGSPVHLAFLIDTRGEAANA